jgi:hypothetical protein
MGHLLRRELTRRTVLGSTILGASAATMLAPSKLSAQKEPAFRYRLGRSGGRGPAKNGLPRPSTTGRK